MSEFKVHSSSHCLSSNSFEHLFKECISSAAILTKFENHHSQGAEIVHELEQLLEQEEQSSVEKRFGKPTLCVTCNDD